MGGSTADAARIERLSDLAWTGSAGATFFPLVGRATAVAAIDAVLAAGRSGTGTLLLLTGEPGVGKSRLAQEAVRLATGFRFAWHGCDRDSSAFRPWTRLLGAVVPGTADVLVEPGPASPREQVFDDVVDLLRTAAVESPLLLVLDDVHDTDTSSLELLVHVGRQLRTAPVVIVATARDGGRAWAGNERIRGELAALGRSLPLSTLTAPEVAELMTASGVVAGPEAVRGLVDRTGGNPLLVTELVAALATGTGPDGATPDDVLPESVRALVAARLGRLPADSATAVITAAALGRAAGPAVLGAVLGLDPAEVARVLDPARAEGLVIETAPGRFPFRHDLLRDAVLQTLPRSEQAALHSRIGTALTETGADPAETAHHLLLAGPGHAEAAASVATQAAECAARLGAYEDAAHWYERAAVALDGVPGAVVRQAKIGLARGEMLSAAGAPDAARAAFLAAAAQSHVLDRPDLLARAALGLAGHVGFEVALLDGAQIDLLTEARDALTDDSAGLRARVAARLSVALSMLASNEQRAALSEEAVDLARTAGDDGALAQALAARCDALAGPEHTRDRREWAGEVIAIAQRIRDPELELLGRRLRLLALLELGDVVGADAEARAYSVVANQLRQPRYGWYVPMWRAMRALSEGRLADSAAELDEARELGRRARSANAEMLLGTLRWCLAAEQDEFAAMDALFDEVDLTEFEGVWPYVAMALVAAQYGRLGEATARLDAVAPWLPDAHRDAEWLPMIAQLAEAIGAVGSHPLADWAYEQLLPYAEMFVVEGTGAALRGPVHRHLGILASSRGDRAAAVAHFDRAVEEAGAIGATLLVARTLRDAGTALSDPDRLAAAHDRYRALGISLRAASSRLETGNRIAREGEHWTMCYVGKEIRLRDSKGLRDVAVLLATPGQEHAALDLATAPGAGPGVSAGTLPDGLHPPGDLGDVVDAQAREAYRRRLKELDEEDADADFAGDSERSVRIALERKALTAQLAAAYGIGGRVRRAGSPGERARTAVTARIRDALRRIEAAHPELGVHLRASVRTGTSCSYRPAEPTTWRTS